MENTLPSIPPVPWTWGRKVSFRFFFVFFGLFVFPFPLNVIPGISAISQPYSQFWTWLINIVGKNILGIQQELTLAFSGSGDKLYDWVQYFTILLLAMVATIIWTILDRKRVSYAKLNRWFLLFLTYYLAYFMFVYGIIKLFYLQFGPPNLERLFQTLGQISPMRLLWTFMGFSESYTMFSGACETLAGLLLVFRRTRTLGGLVAFGVMLNVFMLNMSYDVPVKLFSFQLMIMGLFIAMQDFRRLFNFFVLNKTVPPADHRGVVNSQTGRIITIVTQAALVGFFIINMAVSSNQNRKRYGPEREKSPLYGVYNVETFVLNNDTLPPLATDSVRWRRLLIDYPDFVSAIYMNDQLQRYNTELDTAAQQFTFTIGQDTTNKYMMSYEKIGQDLKMSGVLQGDTLQIDMKYYDLKNFGLLNRGFNWVNEVPYNRYNYDQ
jgi:hypothetical protein